MDNCLKRLRAFARKEPAYRQAVDNIEQDLRSETNPNGNIGPERKKALARGCADPKPDLSHIIPGYQTIARPELTEPVAAPNAPLRRVMSLTNFVTYHLSGEVADTNSNVDELANDLKQELRSSMEQNEPVKYDIEDLSGNTGDLEKPSWWTFQDSHQPDMDDGERYLHELALSEVEISIAREDGMAIEVIIPEQIIPEPLYKPCALDSFGEETRFRPDLGSAPFGRTAPTGPGRISRPELISRSFSYHAIGQDEDTDTENIHVRVNILPMTNTRSTPT
uniref:Uncharacterized protein n=1 Tax=Candidatus Kentrum sp. FW TaxID=2126338 RepID=A0A450TSE2_9GAMM|nr:MAG: hypothetical protein BECKFW1821C_GA0114237_102626 [Candidatus Kentron sp. FW]